jgi:hypothetical protein
MVQPTQGGVPRKEAETDGESVGGLVASRAGARGV